MQTFSQIWVVLSPIDLGCIRRGSRTSRSGLRAPQLAGIQQHLSHGAQQSGRQISSCAQVSRIAVAPFLTLHPLWYGSGYCCPELYNSINRWHRENRHLQGLDIPGNSLAASYNAVSVKSFGERTGNDIKVTQLQVPFESRYSCAGFQHDAGEGSPLTAKDAERSGCPRDEAI